MADIVYNMTPNRKWQNVKYVVIKCEFPFSAVQPVRLLRSNGELGQWRNFDWLLNADTEPVPHIRQV